MFLGRYETTICAFDVPSEAKAKNGKQTYQKRSQKVRHISAEKSAVPPKAFLYIERFDRQVGGTQVEEGIIAMNWAHLKNSINSLEIEQYN